MHFIKVSAGFVKKKKLQSFSSLLFFKVTHGKGKKKNECIIRSVLNKKFQGLYFGLKKRTQTTNPRAVKYKKEIQGREDTREA